MRGFSLGFLGGCPYGLENIFCFMQPRLPAPSPIDMLLGDSVILNPHLPPIPHLPTQQGLEPSEDEAALLSRLLMEADLIPQGAADSALSSRSSSIARRRAAARAARAARAASSSSDDDEEDDEGDEEEGVTSVLGFRDSPVRPDLTLVRWPGQQPKTRRERRALNLRRARLQKRSSGAAPARQDAGAGAGGSSAARVTRQPNEQGGVDLTLDSWGQLLSSFKSQLREMQEAAGAGKGGDGSSGSGAADGAAQGSDAELQQGSSNGSGADGSSSPGSSVDGAAGNGREGAGAGAVALGVAAAGTGGVPPAYQLLLEQRSRAVVQQLRALLPRAAGHGSSMGEGHGRDGRVVVAVVPLALLPYVESEWVRVRGGE